MNYRRRFLGLAIGLASLVGAVAGADSEHSLVRRVTVFPMKAPKDLAVPAEEAWWAIREALTENQRFLVASRNFLIQRDVFQARAELKPADAVILGKLLDANALVTLFLDDHVLGMRVYESEYGRLLWSYDFRLHPSLPVSDQVVGAARKLVYDFVASIPYQGFVTIDPLKRVPMYGEGGKVLAKVHVGDGSKVSPGDPVQFIRLYHDTVRPLFAPDTSIEVYGEGVVAAVDKESMVVEVIRITKDNPPKELSLVRLPKELQRLKDMYAMKTEFKGTVGTEYLSPEITAVQQEVAERKPLVTALTFILNLATFLLLAF